MSASLRSRPLFSVAANRRDVPQADSCSAISPREQLVWKLTRSPRWQGRAAVESAAWRSPLQLAFELVEETPIRTVGDDLVGARLDHAGLVQPQRDPGTFRPAPGDPSWASRAFARPHGRRRNKPRLMGAKVVGG